MYAFIRQIVFWALCRQDCGPKLGSGYCFFAQQSEVELVFLYLSANSMPRIVTAAVSNRLNPSIGRIRCLIRRWSCSTRLFKYLEERICTRRGSLLISLSWDTARCAAA